jgi:acetyl esterase
MLLQSLEVRVADLVLDRLLALPPRVQRRLAGPPVRIDGQTLDVSTQLCLRLQRLTRVPGPETLEVERGRAALDRQARVMGASRPVGVVVDRTLGDLPVRVYLPTALAGSSDPRPTLLFFHGGGFVYGGLPSHDAACRLLAERAGVQVVAVDYRRAPEHPFPAAHDDAVAAYEALVADPEDLRADVTRLGVGGDSAGGNLAAAIALHAARTRQPLTFQALIYPMCDPEASTPSRRLFAEGFYLTQEFIDVATTSYTPDVEDRSDPRIAILHAEIPPGVAPAYVVTAGFDPLRDEGEAYARRLADAGVAVELVRHDDLIHGFLNWVERGTAVTAANHQLAAGIAAGLKTV